MSSKVTSHPITPVESRRLERAKSSVRVAIASFNTDEGSTHGRGVAIEPTTVTALVQKVQRAKEDLTLWNSLPADLRSKYERVHLAYQYRHRNTESSAPSQGLEALKTRIIEVKNSKKSHLYVKSESDHLGLVASDLDQLTQLAQSYPEMVDFLNICDDETIKSFIKFCLRSNCSIDAFVQFPQTAQGIMESHLEKRLGTCLGPQGIIVEDGTVKVLMDSQYVSVQDPDASVEFHNLVRPGARPIVKTVKEIFKIFTEKTYKYGPLDVLSYHPLGQDQEPIGICNWDAIRQGSFNPDTSQTDRVTPETWFDHLPCAARLTKAEIIERYPDQVEQIQRLDGSNWGIAFSASRTRAEVCVNENHAYLAVFKPTGDGVHYDVLPMGLQPYSLPKNIAEKFLSIGNTFSADIHFPDESWSLTQRQHTGEFYTLSEEEVEALKEIITYELNKARDKHKVFQPQGNNCANFILKIFYELFVERLLFTRMGAIIEAHMPGRSIELLRDLRRAAKTNNVVYLEATIEKICAPLTGPELVEVAGLCRGLVERVFSKENLEAVPQHVTYPRDLTNVRSLTRTLLRDTLQSFRLFNVPAIDVENLVAFNEINNFIKRLIKNNIISPESGSIFYKILNYVLLAAWRFVVFFTETGAKVKSLLNAKNFTQPILTLNLPAVLWGWKRDMETRSNLIGRDIQALSSALPRSVQALRIDVPPIIPPIDSRQLVSVQV